MTWRRLLPLAAVLLVAYAALGLYVASAPPGPLDRAALRLRGHGVGAAILTDQLGDAPGLHRGLRRAPDLRLRAPGLAFPGRLSIVTLVAAWQTSDFCKLLFARPRMAGWIAIHETSFSYRQRARHPVGGVLRAVGLLSSPLAVTGRGAGSSRGC